MLVSAQGEEDNKHPELLQKQMDNIHLFVSFTLGEYICAFNGQICKEYIFQMELYYGFGIVCEKTEISSTHSALYTHESDEKCVVVLKETIQKVGVNEPIGVHTMNARIPGYMEEFMHLVCINDKRPEWIVFSLL
jgi:hypothetical protein